MSAQATLAIPTSQESSKDTSFDSRRSSSGSAQQQKPEGDFLKRVGRAIKQRAIEHHRSVQAAHRAVYGA